MNFFFLYFLIFLPCFWAEEETLRLVHVIFRHGSRTPDLTDIYPTDPYGSETFSEVGYGGLTKQGKMMSFQLGKLLRNRYQNFLGDFYTPEIVDPTSTGYERTRMTLLLVLAGLFPPAPSQKWHDSFNWLPIPYNYEKYDKDYLLRRAKFYCPAFVNEVDRVLATPEGQKYTKDQEELFKYIEEHTKRSTKTVFDALAIYQTLYAEDSMNLTLPEWAKSIYPSKLKEVAAQVCYFENSTPLLKRLNGGRLLGKVIDHMVAKANNSLQPTNRKLFLYSCHENNVLNILAALDLFKTHFPKYSSSVLIELHYVKDVDDYGVKVFYSTDSSSEPELQKLENCAELCPLSQFVKLTIDRIPVNYTAECESNINLD